MIQAIDRAARVLAALQGSRHLGITELGAILELPPSTVHGIVEVAAGRTGWWSRSRTASATCSARPCSSSPTSTSTPSTSAPERCAGRETSASAPGLAVRLGVEFFDQVIVIHHEPRPDGTRQMPETGLTIPAHASALGKVLLAYRPAFLQSLLAKVPAAQPDRRDDRRSRRAREGARRGGREGVRRRGRGGRPRRGLDRRPGGRPRRRGDRRDRRRAARQPAAGRRLGAHAAAREPRATSRASWARRRGRRWSPSSTTDG